MTNLFLLPIDIPFQNINYTVLPFALSICPPIHRRVQAKTLLHMQYPQALFRAHVGHLTQLMHLTYPIKITWFWQDMAPPH